MLAFELLFLPPKMLNNDDNAFLFQTPIRRLKSPDADQNVCQCIEKWTGWHETHNFVFPVDRLCRTTWGDMKGLTWTRETPPVPIPLTKVRCKMVDWRSSADGASSCLNYYVRRDHDYMAAPHIIIKAALCWEYSLTFWVATNVFCKHIIDVLFVTQRTCEQTSANAAQFMSLHLKATVPG